MNRRRFLRTGAVAAGLTSLGAGGWWVWDQSDWLSLYANCQSDNLSTVAARLQEYADRESGMIPPAEDLLTVAGGFPWCKRMGLPFQWDLRLAGYPIAALEGNALAWCPPGGHGRYVGAIVIREGRLRSTAMTVAELRRLVAESK